MPDDCYKAFNFEGNIEEVNRAEIFQRYAETSYLENFGKKAIDDVLGQPVEDKEALEGIDLLNSSLNICAADDLFS